jgi:hypothetical protein
MYERKRISEHAIPQAVKKAERYRLLNEPAEAESICLDVLEVDPDHEEATVILILALSDQIEERMASVFRRAEELVARLPGEYAREYYGGLLCERRARALRRRGGADSGDAPHDWLRRALDHFARALELRPPDNDEAVLRWNSCVRMMESDPALRAPHPDTFQPLLE